MRTNDRPSTVIGIEPEMLAIATSQGSITPQLVSCAGRRPATIVLGSVPGEPPRPDLRREPELTGSGVPPHPVAAVDERGGSGRLPVAYAWMGLQLRDNPTWTWESPGGVSQRVAWQDAVALTCGEAVSAVSRVETRFGPSVCVTIPNTLDLDAQDSVRRAVTRRCPNATLLWRPIAAAIEWLARYESELLAENTDMPMEQPIGRLLVVDLGLGAFEVTAVDLLRRDGRILAARRLPDLPILHGAGVRFADQLGLRMARAQGLTHRTAPWTLVWCTDLLAEMSNPAAVTAAEGLNMTAARECLKRLGLALTEGCRLGNDREWATSFVTRLMPMAQFRRPRLAADARSTNELGQWLHRLRERLDGAPPFQGMVAVGVLSSAVCGQSRLGETVASSIAPSAVQRILTERVGGCGSILATGAARFENLRLAGLVPYLDSLPDIETLLQERGEPVWARLLESHDRYVRGGQPWARDVSGSFAVRAEEQELRLTVSQEGEATVREVDYAFPRPVLRETPVALHVKLTPGQGNPRVEVIPHDRRIFAGRRFYLDWRRSKDTGKTKQQAAEEMERIFPPLEARQSSAFCWRAVEYEIQFFLTNCRLPTAMYVDDHLGKIRELLRQKDENLAARTPPDHATAVGSDGVLDEAWTLFGAGYDRTLLDAFEERLVAWLDDSTARGIHEQIYRVVGYFSSASKSLVTRLRDLLSRPHAIKRHHLNAYANCLRDPEQIARFADVMAAHLQHTGFIGPNDWLRALARILQYRAAATERMKDETCGILLDLAHDAMKKQLRHYEAKYIYRHASLCIAYLLRRRRYSASFLDPVCTRATDLKETLKWAATGLRSRRIQSIGGFVDLAAVTELIIDYIDRRGKGRIVLLTE